jgi:hypothetical protein
MEEFKNKLTVYSCYSVVKFDFQRFVNSLKKLGYGIDLDFVSNKKFKLFFFILLFQNNLSNLILEDIYKKLDGSTIITPEDIKKTSLDCCAKICPYLAIRIQEEMLYMKKREKRNLQFFVCKTRKS